MGNTTTLQQSFDQQQLRLGTLFSIGSKAAHRYHTLKSEPTTKYISRKDPPAPLLINDQAAVYVAFEKVHVQYSTLETYLKEDSHYLSVILQNIS